MTGTNWTRDEFLVLVENPTASDGQLATMLPWRTVGAIRRARSFFHSYPRSVVHSSHSGGHGSGLSELLLRDPAGRPGVAGFAVAAA